MILLGIRKASDGNVTISDSLNLEYLTLLRNLIETSINRLEAEKGKKKYHRL